MEKAKPRLGGQAVIEGVMMRSPRSLAVAIRKQDGQIVVKEDIWRSVWERLRFLRWPFFRGGVVLIESLANGIQALTFSANQAAEDDEEAEKLSPTALFATVAVAMVLGIVLFVVLPHFLTGFFGKVADIELSVSGILFHLIDGLIKVIFFVAYVWGISLIKEIRRVFEYHGAEHMSIFAYESGLDLTVENARKFETHHPRCGTSFLMVVLIVSILLFSVAFPFMPRFAEMNSVLRNLIYVAIKIPLLFPIAGISYEIIKLAGKKPDSTLLHWAVLPGLWLQKITTRRPSDDQLEIALLALRKTLWRETQGEAGGEGRIESFANFEEALASIGDGD